MTATSSVSFEGVSRHFGEVRAVDDVTFDIGNGEFFCMLGPSGSGKTTCLRLIAGFDQPDRGQILLRGISVAGKPPYERDVNTVFQDYALFPHMTVAENIGYGLMIKKVAKAERDTRVAEMLSLIQLDGMGGRKPSQLSGGQRQRVALARALINRPGVLLLDEPLGALDLKLRQQMQLELKTLQQRVGITFIFVTHDQEEALAMSDRIAVFNRGKIEQIGTPAALYESPATRFVAGFMGTSNVVDGAAARALTGRDHAFAIRPEKIRFGAPDAGMMGARGRLIDATYLGLYTRYTVELDTGGQLLVIEQNTGVAPREKGPVDLSWSAAQIRELA
jgi:putative spermidine/putrescine transport system ATP-binding protein